MEAMLKKCQQKYKKVKVELDAWDELQSQLLKQFSNASSIIERLPILQDRKNYGHLTCVDGITSTIVGKQLESLHCIVLSMNDTLREFDGIIRSLEKILSDTKQLLKGVSMHQTRLRIGIWPTLSECLEKLNSLYNMHHSEYLLKSSIISALAWNLSAADLSALHQLLADQANIPKEEVELIFILIFAEESS